MKIRSGFVSNSSSSSFLIYGANVSDVGDDTMKEALKKLTGKDTVKGYREDIKIDDLDGSYEIGEYLADALGLDFHGNSDYGYYLGSSWDSIGDDETGKQFKTRIETALKTALGDDVSVATHEEAWYG
jgi:hypothetical protein